MKLGNILLLPFLFVSVAIAQPSDRAADGEVAKTGPGPGPGPSYPALSCIKGLNWLRTAVLPPNESRGMPFLGNQFIASGDMIATIDSATNQPVILTKEGVLHPSGKTCKSGSGVTVDDFVAEKINSEIRFSKVDVVNCKPPETEELFDKNGLPARPPSAYSCFEGYFSNECSKLGPKTAAAIQNAFKRYPKKN